MRSSHRAWLLEADTMRSVSQNPPNPTSCAPFFRLPPSPIRTAAFTKGNHRSPKLHTFQTLLHLHRGMDGQTKMSSPTFSNNPSDGNVGPRSAHFTPIRPDHVGSQDQPPATDGYDSNRSPSGSATMGDSGGSKRRKVNHGKCNSCIFSVMVSG